MTKLVLGYYLTVLCFLVAICYQVHCSQLSLFLIQVL